MFIIYFECYFADVNMVLFSRVHRKPEAAKSLRGYFPTCKEFTVEMVIVKLCSHRNCIPGKCVLLQVTAVPLSRQNMAELLSSVSPFLLDLFYVKTFHLFLFHSLSSHQSVNILFLLK